MTTYSRITSVDISVTWCAFSDGEKAYSYNLRVPGRGSIAGGKYATIHDALLAVAKKFASVRNKEHPIEGWG